MRSSKLWVVAALAGLAAAGPALAQPDDPQAPAEALRHWQYYQEVRPADGGDANPYRDVVLTPGVFGWARADLDDLRLYDDRGREVPYALRVLREQTVREPLAVRVYNRGVTGDGASEVWIDLGEVRREHNEIVIELEGTNYRRAFELDGSDTEGQWSTLLNDAHVTRYDYGGQHILVNRFRYPASRFRYLRLVVQPDADADPKKKANDVAKVEILHTTQVPGEAVSRPGQLGPRQAMPTPAGPGSAWYITFDGDSPPCERLEFQAAGGNFTRSYQLEGYLDTGAVVRVTQGTWQRTGGAGGPLYISFPEQSFRKYRLLVTDMRNPPLWLDQVRYTAPARQVVFRAIPDLARPLKLYYGNPAANDPGYDFAASLPDRLARPPLREQMGPRTPNPVYEPVPPPWTERWPGLVYAVLGLACLVLLVLLVLLGRQAIARHDRAREGERASAVSRE